MNAYYSELMFRSTSGDLDVPGVATEHPEGEWVEITPIGKPIVTSIAISAYDLIGIIDVAAPLLTLNHVVDIEKILARVKANLASDTST